MEDNERQRIYFQTHFFNSPWLLRHNINWSELKTYGSLKKYKKNVIIEMSSEKPATAVGYLAKGRIRSSVINEQGEEKIILVIDEGNLLDTMSVIDNLPSYLVSTTLTECHIYWIPKDLFLSLLDTKPNLMRMLLLDTTHKNRILTTHVEDMAFLSSSARISKCLCRLAADYGVPHGQNILLNIKFTHHEMAIFTGTCRVTVTNILENMKTSGILDKENGYFIIHDMEKLKNIIEKNK